MILLSPVILIAPPLYSAVLSTKDEETIILLSPSIKIAPPLIAVLLMNSVLFIMFSVELR